MRFPLRQFWSRFAHSGAAQIGQGIRQHGQQKGRNTFLWLTAAGVGVGAAYGLGINVDTIRRYGKPPMASAHEELPFVLTKVPDYQPSRSIKFANDKTGLKLTLFQYQTCPFCCKVRAMLNYFGISYDIVEVNPVLRSQMKWSETYKKVPILVVQTPEGHILQLNDSTMIISCLFTYLISPRKNPQDDSRSLYNIAKFYPGVRYTDEDGKTVTEVMNRYFFIGEQEIDVRKPEAVKDERKWRKWTDSTFVHTLSPNIYRTLPEAIDSFRNFDKVGEWEKNFPDWQRTLVIYVGAFAMWIIGKRLQKRHNLAEDVRYSLYLESDIWMKELKKRNMTFMGGDKPNLADLAMYGVLNSIEGCEAFTDLGENSRIIKDWYVKVKDHMLTPGVVAENQG